MPNPAPAPSDDPAPSSATSEIARALLLHSMLGQDEPVTVDSMVRGLRFTRPQVAAAIRLLRTRFEAPLLESPKGGELSYEYPFHLPPELRFPLEELALVIKRWQAYVTEDRPEFYYLYRHHFAPWPRLKPDARSILVPIKHLDWAFIEETCGPGEGLQRYYISFFHTAIRDRAEVIFGHDDGGGYLGPIDEAPCVRHPLRLFEGPWSWQLLTYNPGHGSLEMCQLRGLGLLKRTGRTFDPHPTLDTEGFLRSRDDALDAFRLKRRQPNLASLNAFLPPAMVRLLEKAIRNN